MGEITNYKTTRLMIGNFPLEEIRILLQNWLPGERNADFTKRLIDYGILDKKTASAVVGKVRMFKGWFEYPDDRAARRLQNLVVRGIDSQILRELVFLYKTRTERVLRDFTVDVYWPAVQRGEIYLSSQTVYEFIHQKQSSGHLNSALTKSVVIHLQRAITGSLVNAGLLEQRKNVWELLTYRFSDNLVAYLAYDLHFDDQSDNSLVDNADWMLFGMDREHIIDRLSQLDKRYGLVIQHAGSLVRITWLYSSMDEVLDAYTR